MRRTLEALFRHPLELLILIALLPSIGVAIMYFMTPKTYQSTASLWALQRYFVITSTGVESNLLQTEAQTQATALQELLQTRTFVDSVVRGIDLAPTLKLSTSNPTELEDALFNEISKHVVVTPSDEYLYTISYPNRSPQIAQKIVAAVINNFGNQGLALSRTEGNVLLIGYQEQLAAAQKDLDAAVNDETRYASAHPTETPNQLLASDSQYALLDTNKTHLQTVVQNLESTINTIQQAITTQGTQVGTLFRVVDDPSLPYTPVSRSKSYLTGGGIGLAVALLAAIIYLVIVVRLDRGVHSSYDLQNLVTFPVIMEIPDLTPATRVLLTQDKTRSQPLAKL